MARWSKRSLACFNEAAANWPRRYPPRSPWPRRARALQWGRGEFAAEIACSQGRFDCPWALQWGRGEFAAEMAAGPGGMSGRPPLQWGRGEFAAEMTRSATRQSSTTRSFNEAAANSPRRCPTPEPPMKPNTRASMRPRRIRRGDIAMNKQIAGLISASMRPRRIRRGDLCLAAIKEHAEVASMRPRRIRRGDADGDARGRLGRVEASMRPRRIRRGDRCPITSPTTAAPLQWGRGEFAAEIALSAAPIHRRSSASMRPRRIRRGDDALQAALDDATQASMRPRRIRRGDGAAARRAPGRGRASMRPRRIRRGDLWGWASVVSVPRLQWGRGEFAAEMQQNALCLDAQSQLQWGRGEFAAEIRVNVQVLAFFDLRFNEAAANSPRRSGGRLDLWLPLASGFNEAAANSPRRCAAASLPPRPLLQASMRPRRIRRGDQPLQRWFTSSQSRLQWGRGEFAAEIARRGAQAAR